MYCSNCGAAAAQGTSYCNLCGAKLNGAQGGGAIDPSGLTPDSLVWAAVAVFVVGLGGMIGLLAVMKETVGFSNRTTFAIAAVFLLLTLVIEAVFVGLLLKRTRAVNRAADADSSKSAETKELGAARPHALPEPAPSVTEQTTRAFEPSYVERGAAKR